MGFDVGAVTIDYSVARPSGAAYRFAQELTDYESFDDDYWKVDAPWNTFLEIEHEAMVRHAGEHTKANDLTGAEAAEVMDWVQALPWTQGRVMLHLGRH